MSRRKVREGVSWMYLFHTWMAISCGEERGERVLEVIFAGTAVDDGVGVLFVGGVDDLVGVGVLAFAAADCAAGFFAILGSWSIDDKTLQVW